MASVGPIPNPWLVQTLNHLPPAKRLAYLDHFLVEFKRILDNLRSTRFRTATTGSRQPVTFGTAE